MTSPLPQPTLHGHLTYQQPIRLTQEQQFTLTSRLVQGEDGSYLPSVATSILLTRHYIPGRDKDTPVPVTAGAASATARNPRLPADQILITHTVIGKPSWTSQQASYHQLNSTDKVLVNDIISKYLLPPTITITLPTPA